MLSLIKNSLSNMRLAFETRAMQRQRKRKWDALVAAKLRGTFAHISSRVLTLPERGVDAKIDHAIVAQQIRDVTEIKVPGVERDRFGQPIGRPTYIRVGREKGTTYRHPSKDKYQDMKRKERRAHFSSEWRTMAAA